MVFSKNFLQGTIPEKNLNVKDLIRKLCVWAIPKKSSGTVIKKISAEKLVLDTEQINGLKHKA